MKVSVFGLGYVGVVTAGCLARMGHVVWGVDVNPMKVAMVHEGRSPVVEPGLAALIREARVSEALHATLDAGEAVLNSDVSLICVGTPSRSNGSLDIQAVERVAEQIGAALRDKRSRHCVALRSTVLPGTTRNVVIPILAAASGRKPHQDFDVCFNPEFLREGSSIRDYRDPPFTVIGEETAAGGDALLRIYDGVDGRRERTTYEIAEMLKYACNGFHALKVSFANEIGVLCKSIRVDSHEVMKLFALDTKLNISPAYLRPGFAFGGSCLPKDLRALAYKAKEKDLTLPLLGAIMESNRLHIQRVVDSIVALKRRRLGFLGLSFKRGTDDLRESPIVPVIETLLGKGYSVSLYDADVRLAAIGGANKTYIEHEIPHIAGLMATDVQHVVENSDVLVVSKPEAEYRLAILPHAGSKIVVDLVRLFGGAEVPAERYEGICW